MGGKGPAAPKATASARTAGAMEKYKNVWAWMLLPMAVMQAGIFVDYWGDFAENTWAVHVHYWLATLWYVFLISQPYLFAQGRMELHRTFGIIGMFIAGAVAFTGISQLNRDLVYANFVRENPGGIGPFEPWFFLGIAMMEIVLISGFIIAVLMAIIQRRKPEDHAWWLITTVFILMMPALGRGLQAAWIAHYGFGPEIDIVVMPPIYLSQAILIALTLATAFALKKLTHPATFLAVGVNGVVFFMEPLGRTEALQNLLYAVIRP